MPNLPGLSRRLITGNEDEFGLYYRALKFPGRRRQVSADRKRQELLASLAEQLQWTAGGTKPHIGELSPGCQQCVAGNWSCLFINASCNASCFYCPTAQDRGEIPATNNLSFRHPRSYTTYLKRLGFSGSSISGGEPLLTLNRTLAFLRAARKGLGKHGHLWMYTNGILLTREIAGQLAEAGLDEIRFDIGATGYKCHKIAEAKGLIPVISIEIPAVPEAVSTLKQVLPELPELGVNHLNLHQLRLTQHNFRQMNERNYTFLHGEKITVLDSELAALEILSFVHRTQLNLPVNYCSFVFKHRHQKAAALRRVAQLDKRPWETVTRAGFIRKLALCGEAKQLQQQVELWQQTGQDTALWNLSTAASRLEISPQLIPLIRWHRLRLTVSYAQVQLMQEGKLEPDEWTIPLDSGEVARVIRRAVSSEILLGPTATRQFSETWLAEVSPANVPVSQRIFGKWEHIPEGLQPYF
ncbi:radical SAM protein [Geopsychrobacter electrodiphilus]|uniref:radical SAM protein n=1 Tax=Geopsychrobacter electrodiphilus TaxID=225196 RepID=UPI000366484B|nr:radical SAM protein [Geopsychrobacter electrodiphilus]